MFVRVDMQQVFTGGLLKVTARSSITNIANTGTDR
jgi:hypothetical protein